MSCMSQPAIQVACVFPEMFILEQIGKFLYYIAPALVAVGLGTYLVQKFFVSRANEATLIDLLLRDFEALRSDSLEYWNLTSDGAENDKRQKILEQKMKGAIRGISADIQYYCDRYCIYKKADWASLMEKVADACTGGEFESLNKQVDAKRYLLIVNAISSIKSELFRRKL